MRQLLFIGLILFVLCRSLTAQVNISEIIVTYNAKQTPLGQILKEISEKYTVQFFYSTDKIPVSQKISLDIKNQPLQDVLEKIKTLAGIDFKIKGSKVILFAGGKKPSLKRAFSIYGFVEDSLTGERLIGATITLKNLGTGAVTNAYGYFSLPLNKGEYIIRCSSIGYIPIERRFKVEKDICSGFKLQTNLQQLKEIKVSGKSFDKTSTISPGSEQVTLKMLQTFPALFGENDPLQFLRMLPGVQHSSEGSVGLYVRGSPPGQNSFLLDDAPLFNISHISGLFSSINPDAIKDIHIYKSHIPSRYSGTLGSAIDIRLRDGNNQNFSVAGGVGMLSSRLTVEGPIVKNKASFIISARRSYLAQLLQLFNNSSDLSQIYFYDAIGKINFSPNTRNRFYLSAYYSKDNALQSEEGMIWTNSMLSFRWNYLFSSKLFSNLTLTGSDYLHTFNVNSTDNFTVNAKIQNAAFKYDLFYYPKEKLQLNFGLSTNYQVVLPVELNINDSAKLIHPYYSGILDRSVYKLYADVSVKVSPKLSLQSGIQFNSVINYSFDQVFPRLFPEPSAMIAYKFSPVFSFKAGYSRNMQSYLSESIINMVLPFDMLVFANNKIKPQFSDNFTLGWYFIPQNGKFELALESYYKSLRNQYRFNKIDEFNIVDLYKDSIIYGSSKAYGLEFSMRKYSGRFNALVSYTFSKVTRQEEQVFNGATYHPFYDRPHHLVINLYYQFSKQFSSMLTWTYLSGNLYNMPIGKYEINGASIPVFELESFNPLRMPPTHHLDIGLQWKFKSKGRYQHKLSLNFYNVYFRNNLQYYTFRDVYDNDISKDDPEVALARKFSTIGFYLFQFVPAFSYEFKF